MEHRFSIEDYTMEVMEAVESSSKDAFLVLEEALALAS